VHSLIKLNATVTCQLPAWTANKGNLISCFYGATLDSYGKNLRRLAISHAVPAGSWEITAAFNFNSEGTAVFIYIWFWRLHEQTLHKRIQNSKEFEVWMVLSWFVFVSCKTISLLSAFYGCSEHPILRNGDITTYGCYLAVSNLLPIALSTQSTWNGYSVDASLQLKIRSKIPNQYYVALKKRTC
jgi:hypothetical protein